MSEMIDLKDLERRMEGAVDVLKTEFAGLRTGRASAGLLEPVTVEPRLISRSLRLWKLVHLLLA